mgnify:CR=1 FL=1
MIPQKGSPIVEIPVTFDSNSKPQGLGNDKFILAILVFGVWLISAILSFFTELEFFNKILYVVGSFVFAMFIIRILIMREPYFKKKRNELIEKNYKFPYSTFWNIYEITESYPHICRYANGLKAIFVVFDKDVIVGREENNDYNHYEAIADAYLQMHKRGIDCMHIDYMDTVGKDDRVLSLFEMANGSENEDLKEILLRVFDNVEDIMQHSYASYDVYCFYYNGKDELFMDELEVVLDAFLEANYIRCRILNKEEIGELVKSIFNIEKFSVNYASEKLFSDLGGTNYLKPIWIERGGERKILNKTREELEAEREVREAEANIRKSKKKVKNRTIRRLREDTDIDLFEEENTQNYGENNYQQEDNYFEDYNYVDNNQDYNDMGYIDEYVENNQEVYSENDFYMTENQEVKTNELNNNEFYDIPNNDNFYTEIQPKKEDDFDEEEEIDLF